MRLNFLYTVQLMPYLMFVSNFKILGQVVPEKSLTKISIFITKVRDRKKENRKKGKNKSQHLGFDVNNRFVVLIVYTKFKDPV